MLRKPILLIDDDPSILHMYTLKFSMESAYQLVTASTPETGLELAKRIGPSLVLLDLIMPKHGGLPQILNKEVGFQVLERLKSDPDTKDVPVVVLTNLDEQNQGNVERAKKLGALDYWVKANHPPAEIVEMVGRILS